MEVGQNIYNTTQNIYNIYLIFYIIRYFLK